MMKRGKNYGILVDYRFEEEEVFVGRTDGRRYKALLVLVSALFFLFMIMDSAVYARAGGGRSSGSRGMSSPRTYQRTTPTQPSGTTQQQPGMAQRAPVQQPQPSFGRSLLYGIGGGLLGGMIGNLLFGGAGHAAGGGWGGSGGFGFGDIIIILLILGIGYWVFRRFKARREMQMSAAGPAGYGAYAYNEPAEETYPSQSREDSALAGLRHIKDMDSSFDEGRFKETVEDQFFKIQSAWTKRDLTGVKQLLNPEMQANFQTEIDRAIAKKEMNRLENVAVRQVEIVDAVQDQGEEYITVKFLASLLDYTVDETTGRVVSGSASDPVKFLEYWTFARKVGERNWVLAGITQEADY
jgi:predicted lipid-binding transport protein (Tim44 family)